MQWKYFFAQMMSLIHFWAIHLGNFYLTSRMQYKLRNHLYIMTLQLRFRSESRCWYVQESVDIDVTRFAASCGGHLTALQLWRRGNCQGNELRDRERGLCDQSWACCLQLHWMFPAAVPVLTILRGKWKVLTSFDRHWLLLGLSSLRLDRCPTRYGLWLSAVLCCVLQQSPVHQ